MQAGLGANGQNHALQMACQAFLVEEPDEKGQDVQEAVRDVPGPWRHHAAPRLPWR